jgi:hypothetical protein
MYTAEPLCHAVVCAGKQIIVVCESGGSIENKSGTKVGVSCSAGCLVDGPNQSTAYHVCWFSLLCIAALLSQTE